MMMTHWLKQLAAPHRTARSSKLRLESLEDRTTPTQLAYGLFDTAVDGTGAILTSGVDTHYTITGNPDGSGPDADITSRFGTGYISPNASGLVGSGGHYLYETTFTIPVGTTLTGATLSGLITASIIVHGIRIDGVSAASTPSLPVYVGYAPAKPFSVGISGLSTGSHTLTFVIANPVGGSEELKVSNLVLNVAPRADAAAPPVLTGSGSVTSALAGGAGIAVDPNLTITGATGNLASASVAITRNLDVTEDRLLFTNQNGITGSYNTANGVLTLTGTATVAQYETALRSVQYQNIDGANPSFTARMITFSFVPPGAYVDPTSGHFYEFVSAPSINWGAAEAAASGRTIFGLQGYLATLRSDAENSFAATKAGAADAWIGASDAASEGVWQWATGPDAGIQFWQGLSGGSTVGGEYNNWTSTQPNDSGGQDYAHLRPNARWNDLVQTESVAGYVVEYGGSVNDPSLQLTSDAFVVVVGPSVTSPATATSVNAATFSITGAAEAGSLVQIYLDVNNNGVIDVGDTVVSQQQLGTGTAFNIVTPLTQDAANNFLVTATSAGDAMSPPTESAPTDVPTITEDSIAPVDPTVTSPATATSVNAATFPITGTAEAGSLVRVYIDVNINDVIDAGDTVVSQQQLSAGATAFSVATPLTQDAANNFLVTATDAVNNQSTPVAVSTITEDSITPVGPTVTSPAAATSVNAATFPITGTAEAGSLVRVYIDVNNNGVIDAGDTVVSQQQLGVGATAFSVTTPLTQDAANNFLVRATDAANNQSTPVDVPTITEDSITPVGPTVTSPATATSVNADSFPITGTAEAGSLVQIYLDVNNNGVIDGGDTVVSQQQLGAAATAFNIATLLTQDAANNFLVTATDAAGNESLATDVPTITENSSPLTGVVFVDANADGVQNPGERGFPGEDVFFDTNSNGRLDPGEPVATTDAAGRYTFPTVQVGTSGAVERRPSFASTDSTPRDGNFAAVPVSPVVPVFPQRDLYRQSSSDANENYVRGLYRTILGREASGLNVDGSAEFTTYTRLLPVLDSTNAEAHEAARRQVALLIWNSAEHRNLQVDSYYRQLLGRERAGEAASQGHVDALLAGVGELDVVGGILQSAEFLNRFSDAGERLRFLFANLLGESRPRDFELHTNGIAFDAAAPGTSPEGVIRSVVFSDESVFRQINGMYLAFLQREVDEVGLQTWSDLERLTDSPTLPGAYILANPEFFLKVNGSA